MRVRLLAAVLALLPLAGLARAQTPSDSVDAVFLGDVKPVLFRFHVTVNGQPYRQAWNDFVYDLFRFLDRDGDLVLNKAEAGLAPSPNQLYQFRLGAVFNQQIVNNAAGVKAIDANGDGKVTLDELAAYYERETISNPVMLMSGNSTVNNVQLTDTLFRHLDLNKDGKLSRDELDRATDCLRTFDVDDDEMVTMAELLQNQNNPYYYFQPQPMAGAAGQLPFALYGRGVFTAGLVRTLITKYDKNQNFKLSREEIRLDKAVFDRLDADKDGELGAQELVELFGLPPDVEVVFRLGNTKEPPAELYRSPKRILSLTTAVKSTGPGLLTVQLDDGQVQLGRGPSSGVYIQPARRDLRQAYLQQFRLADTDKNGYLDKKEAQNPQFRYWLALFAFIDRDGDDRISEKEVNAYFDLQAKLAAGTAVLTVTDSGRELFSAFDGNRDGRLGLRELRTLWSRLGPLDRDGDGCIARSEIPRLVQLNVDQGAANYYGGRVAFTAAMATSPMPPPAKGPLWFRKMDRNADGDVSYREFLGSKEEFRRLDTDGDGLIDLKEAERAGAKVAVAIPPGAFRTR